MDVIENNELNISIDDLFLNKNIPLKLDTLRNFSTVEEFDSLKKRYLKEENIIKLIKEYLKRRELKIIDYNIQANIIKLFPTVNYDYNLILIIKEKIDTTSIKKLTEKQTNNKTIKTIISYGLFDSLFYIEEFVNDILIYTEEVL